MACLRRYLFCLLITAPSLFAAGIESAMGATISFVPGWTLAGNGSTGPMTVASVFGDSTKVVTVWKWVSSKGVWAFYTPGIADGGAAFAASKGYDALTTINGGEGFWVNAKTAFTATLPTGSAVTSASFQSTLPAGWSLIAIGDSKAPRDFDIALSTTPPAPGVIPTNLTTLWAWDPTQSNWYFYAPALDANATLSSYVASKSYLSFGTKVLDREGFEAAAVAAIEAYDFGAQRVPGQGFVQCPEAVPFVSAGVGRRTRNPEDFVLREYRGNVETFLRREHAAKVEGCALVVYTKDA